MDIHTPKPIHGWRDFVKEIGTIVLGVLIALAAEQAAEAVHWQRQVAEARQLLATELARNAANAINRLKVERCTEQRLDQLAAVLDGAARSGVLPPVGDIGNPRIRQWPSGGWDSVVASQTATHFPRDQLAGLSYIYGLVRRTDDAEQPEQLAWNELDVLVGPGRRFDPASEAQLRAALGHARYYGRVIALTGMRINQAIQSQHIAFSPGDLAIIAQAQNGTPAHPPQDGYLTPYTLCQPIGAVPPNYGQATLGALLPLMDAAARERMVFDKK